MDYRKREKTRVERGFLRGFWSLRGQRAFERGTERKSRGGKEKFIFLRLVTGKKTVERKQRGEIGYR